MQKVIFDSSFLIAVGEEPTGWKEDIAERLGGLDPAIPECVLRELKRMGSQAGGRSRGARVALQLASSFRVLPCGLGSPDDEIMSLALSTGEAVATIDRDLARDLRDRGVRVITLRKGRVWLP